MDTGGWYPSELAAPLYTMVNDPLVANDSNFIYSPNCTDQLEVQLREGGTLIATRVLTTNALETYVITLTDPEKSLIVDWSNLAVWFDVYAAGQIAKIALGTMNPPFPGPVTLLVRARKVEV